MTTDKQDSRVAFEAWSSKKPLFKPHSKKLWDASWKASREQALASAEDRVTTLYEAQEPPYLVDICRAIKDLK